MLVDSRLDCSTWAWASSGATLQPPSTVDTTWTPTGQFAKSFDLGLESVAVPASTAGGRRKFSAFQSRSQASISDFWLLVEIHTGFFVDKFYYVHNSR